MSVHPDLTARRAVDACGGTFPTPRNDYDTGYERGYEAALEAAMVAVATADALTADLLEALRWSLVALESDWEEAKDCADEGWIDRAWRNLKAARAAIRKATGEGAA